MFSGSTEKRAISLRGTAEDFSQKTRAQGFFFQVWKTIASSSPDVLKGSPALLGEGSGCFGQAVEEAGEVGSIREEKVTGAKKEMTDSCRFLAGASQELPF